MPYEKYSPEEVELRGGENKGDGALFGRAKLAESLFLLREVVSNDSIPTFAELGKQFRDSPA
jgi:hypothetical protein